MLCVCLSLLLLYTTQQHIATGYKPPPSSHSFSSKYCQSLSLYMLPKLSLFSFQIVDFSTKFNGM